MKQQSLDKRGLEAADRARNEGNTEAAINLYLRLSGARTFTKYSVAAKQRLAELHAEARDAHQALQERLADSLDQQSDQVKTIFDEYKALARKYRRLPVVGKDIKNRLVRHRRDPQLAAILNEPAAAEMLAEGANLERLEQLCCAYHSYQEAARLLPALSAIAARERLAEMDRDPKLVAEAMKCADLQWCHKKYNQAERLVNDYPDKARTLYVAILARAGPDTSVHRAAAEQLALIR